MAKNTTGTVTQILNTRTPEMAYNAFKRAENDPRPWLNDIAVFALSALADVDLATVDSQDGAEGGVTHIIHTRTPAMAYKAFQRAENDPRPWMSAIAMFGLDVLENEGLHEDTTDAAKGAKPAAKAPAKRKSAKAKAAPKRKSAKVQCGCGRPPMSANGFAYHKTWCPDAADVDEPEAETAAKAPAKRKGAGKKAASKAASKRAGNAKKAAKNARTAKFQCGCGRPPMGANGFAYHQTWCPHVEDAVKVS